MWLLRDLIDSRLTAARPDAGPGRLLAAVGGDLCVGCRARGSLLCERCRRAVPAAPTGPLPLGVDRLSSPFAYEGPIRTLILGLKLRARRDHADPLVAAMAETASRRGLVGETIAWVPGRPDEDRRRGFDHAGLLARGVALRTGLQARPLLRRVGDSGDQTGLARGDRWSNLEGVFVARPCSGPIVLIDDLVTSGATASHCAQALRATGATFVEVLSCARA